jgi:transposase-like protein
MCRLEKVVSRRRKYPLYLKAQAVEAVQSGRKMAHVAAEYGMSPRNLDNWLKEDQRGALDATVRLSVDEMESIRDYCALMLSGGLLVEEALAAQKMIIGLDKKMIAMLNQSRNTICKK